MSVKQYLRQIKAIRREMAVLADERKQLWSLAVSMGAPLTGMPHGSGAGDKIGRSVERLMALDAKLDAKTDEYSRRCEEAWEMIDQLTDERHRTILHAYYLSDHSWEEVAQQVGYDVRHVQRLHGAALLAMEDVMVCH